MRWPFKRKVESSASIETQDPEMYALMRAWETGEPVVVNVQDDGTWTDENGKAIDR